MANEYEIKRENMVECLDRDEALKEDILKTLCIYGRGDVKFLPSCWLNQGTKSDAFAAFISGEFRDRKIKKNSFILKRYYENSYDDFITEKAVLSVANEHCEGLFPKLYWTSNERKMLLLEFIENFDLCEIISNANEGLTDFSPLHYILEITSVLKTVARLHSELPAHKEQINENLKSLSGGKIKKLDKLTPRKCVQRFKKSLENAFEYIPLDIKEGLIKNFSEFAKDMAKPQYNTIIQHDSFSKHYAGKKIMDAGSMKEGSCAQQIGCLLGCPELYGSVSESFNQRKIVPLLIEYYFTEREKFRVPHTKIKKSNETLYVRFEKSYEDKLVENKEKMPKLPRINLNQFEKAVYLGAVYSNTHRLRRKTEITNREMKGIRETLENQLSYLKNNFEDTKEFGSLFLEVLARY